MKRSYQKTRYMFLFVGFYGSSSNSGAGKGGNSYGENNENVNDIVPDWWG